MRNRVTVIAAWFLAVSYGIGAPVTMLLEYRNALFSERFDVPPELLYLTGGVQLLCAALVLLPRVRFGAAAALSVITFGAMFAHLRIGSPLTAIPALIYTAVQIWLAVAALSASEESS
jgi:hypothetical protein